MEHSRSKKAKVYGKKAYAPAKNVSAAAIFNSSPPPILPELKKSSVNCALKDITNQNTNVLDQDGESERSREMVQVWEAAGRLLTTKKPALRITRSAVAIPTPVREEKPAVEEEKEQREEWLDPFINEYEREARHTVTIKKWEDVLEEDCKLEKIAESSFAEVYRVTNDAGSSILKVMALKPPKGPGSRRETTVEVADIVSEVLVMDVMTEIPGFVIFKEAHIIKGRPLKLIKDAYDEHFTQSGSFFPPPTAYPKEQLFLVLEMGDAGIDIEKFVVTKITQVWDIFLGVIVALAKGETEAQFEHRDLHEGNVCVRQVRKPSSKIQSQQHKAGHSGLQITLIDYTLSRVNRQETKIFRDLEKDLELFNQSPKLQCQMYRRMRVWTLFRTHSLEHPLFDKPDKNNRGRRWQDCSPYNNVLWIYYILEYLIEKARRDIPLDLFLHDIATLRKQLHPDKPLHQGGFSSAAQVLEFCLAQKWLNMEDVTDMESSRLGSDLSLLEDGESVGSVGSVATSSDENDIVAAMSQKLILEDHKKEKRK